MGVSGKKIDHEIPILSRIRAESRELKSGRTRFADSGLTPRKVGLHDIVKYLFRSAHDMKLSHNYLFHFF